MIVAHVERELAQLEAREHALALMPRSSRRTTGSSVVYSIRLDPAEVRALEARALDIGIKPTVLARNLIRTGLGSVGGAELAAAVDRLEAAFGELRAAVG